MSTEDAEKEAATEGRDVTPMSEEEENRYGKVRKEVIEDKWRDVVTFVVAVR